MTETHALTPDAYPITRRNRVLLPCVALFLFTLVLVFLSMARKIEVYDEGLILVGAERILSGQLPHRDFYANYGPAQFAIVAAFFKMFGSSVLVARVWDAIVRAVTSALVFLLVARHGSRRAAWFAAIGTAIWLAALRFYLYPLFPALAVSIASVIFIAPALEGRAPPRSLMAAGALAAVVGTFRYDVGAALIAAEVIVLVGVTVAFRDPRQKAIRRVAAVGRWFGLGLALVLVPVATFYTASGMLANLVRDLFTFNAKNYVAMRSLPLTNTLSPGGVVAFLPLVVLAASLRVFLARGRNREGLGVPIMVATLTMVLFAKGWVRFSVISMSAAIVVAVVCIALVAPLAWRYGRAPRLLAGGAVALTMLCTALAFFNVLAGIPRNLVWLASGADCGKQAGASRAACFVVSPDRVRASELVQKLTAPGEPVFVGLGRHDKIFISDMLLYFLAERLPATEWSQMDPGVQTTEAVQRAVVAELRQRCVRVVVIETYWDNEAEPNASSRSSGVTLLNDEIRREYAPVATFGGISVLQFQPDHAAPRPSCREWSSGSIVPGAGGRNREEAPQRPGSSMSRSCAIRELGCGRSRIIKILCRVCHRASPRGARCLGATV